VADFDAQLAKLRAGRKKDPPKYKASGAGGRSLPISQDTEDALILLDRTAKNSLVEYIKQFSDNDSEDNSEDYNALLTEFATQQQANSDAIRSELDGLTGKFREFRDSVSFGSSDSLTVESGLQPVLKAMTRSISRLVEIDTHEYFHGVFDTILTEVYKKEVSSGTKEELRSWNRVISSYP
jgi:hypothetical protein